MDETYKHMHNIRMEMDRTREGKTQNVSRPSRVKFPLWEAVAIELTFTIFHGFGIESF